MRRTSRSRGTEVALASCFVVAGLNLRPGLAYIGPVVQDLQKSLPMEYREVRLLIALPTLCMGVFALLLCCILVKRHVHLCAIAIAGIGMATAARLFTGNIPSLLTTALICGTRIAIAQTILPGAIKTTVSPATATRHMARFSAAIMAGAGIAAAIAPVIATSSNDWRLALAVWALLAIPSIWLLKRLSKKLPPSEAPRIREATLRRPDRTTWLLAAYFGMSSGLYAAMLAWLPALYVDIGWASDEAGRLMAYFIFAEVVGGLYIPQIPTVSEDRRYACWLSLGPVVMGLTRILLLREHYWLLWVGALGLGIGALFPLTVLLPVDSAGDASQAQFIVPFVQVWDTRWRLLCPTRWALKTSKFRF